MVFIRIEAPRIQVELIHINLETRKRKHKSNKCICYKMETEIIFVTARNGLLWV